MLNHLQEITSVSESELDKDKSQSKFLNLLWGETLKGDQVKNIVCCRLAKSLEAAASRLLVNLTEDLNGWFGG